MRRSHKRGGRLGCPRILVPRSTALGQEHLVSPYLSQTAAILGFLSTSNQIFTCFRSRWILRSYLLVISRAHRCKVKYVALERCWTLVASSLPSRVPAVCIRIAGLALQYDMHTRSSIESLSISVLLRKLW